MLATTATTRARPGAWEVSEAPFPDRIRVQSIPERGEKHENAGV
jgi:hypothetical protein